LAEISNGTLPEIQDHAGERTNRLVHNERTVFDVVEGDDVSGESGCQDDDLVLVAVVQNQISKPRMKRTQMGTLPLVYTDDREPPRYRLGRRMTRSMSPMGVGTAVASWALTTAEIRAAGSASVPAKMSRWLIALEVYLSVLFAK
jgi:hypothetical protein